MGSDSSISDGGRSDALKPCQRLVATKYCIGSRRAGRPPCISLGQPPGGGFERLVAVKVCHPHPCEDEDFNLMFFDEARLAARIHHPNVVAVFDVSSDGAVYLVMEYIE